MRTIEIEGKRYLWRDVLKLRRDQAKAQRQPQLTLFEMKVDSRPPSQKTVDGRFEEPSLFDGEGKLHGSSERGLP